MVTQNEDEGNEGKAIPPLSKAQVATIFAAMHALGIHKNQDLADRAEVNRSYLSEILNRRAGPGMHVAPKLAKALHLPIAVFVPETAADGSASSGPTRPHVENDATTKAIETLDRRRETGVTLGGRTLRPVIAVVVLRTPVVARVNAGEGGGMPHEDMVDVPSGMLSGRDTFLVEVVGDCLEPEIRSGDHVLIERGRAPRDGDLVCAVLNRGGQEEWILKRWEALAGGRVALVPEIEAPGVGARYEYERPEDVDLEGVFYALVRVGGRRMRATEAVTGRSD